MRWHCEAMVRVVDDIELKCLEPATLRNFRDTNVALCDSCFELISETDPTVILGRLRGRTVNAPVNQVVYSKPTMCLHCRHIVALEHEVDADPERGAWTCPSCGH